MANARTQGRSRIGGTSEGLRRATAVLEVLGGLHTPGEAAGALGIGVQRYYLLEADALRGLVAACEPRGRGRGQNPSQVLRAQEGQIRRLESEVRRLQALVRVSHRALGLAGLTAAAAPAGGDGARGSQAAAPRSPGKKGRRRRSPVARALGMSKLLQEKAVESAEQEVATGGGRAGVAAGEASPGGDPAHDRG